MARDELPFLFKAFELGQKPPPRPGTKRADAPRAATIHEYLDWTVTASEPEDPDELDFAGFRVMMLLPRFKLMWPPPTTPYNTEIPLKHPEIGAPVPPIPHLQAHMKAICAATIRVGPSWIEVPFYATQETRRNKGRCGGGDHDRSIDQSVAINQFKFKMYIEYLWYLNFLLYYIHFTAGNGRALLEAIEDICRFLNLPRILLCSTDDNKVKNTWQRLGFQFTTEEQLKEFGITRHDLLHMDNTVQMHKDVGEKKPWKRVILKHGDFKQRMYYLPGGGHVPPVPATLGMKRNGRMMGVKKPSKPAKNRKR